MKSKPQTQTQTPLTWVLPAPGQLVFVTPEDVLTHPRNMRRIYPATAVRQMAESIKARGGLLQALILTPADVPSKFWAIDGNLRTAGARLLGAECPPLKAELVYDKNTVEQMLDMIATTIRFDPDPISEALHYAALKAEGLTLLEICERTGQYYQRVLNRLRLLELDLPIQDLISLGELHHDLRVVEALLSIPDAEARIALARKLSAAKAKISVIVSACAKLKDSLAQAAPKRKSKSALTTPAAPMLALAQTRAQKTTPAAPIAVPAVRAAAHAMCQACEIHAEQLKANCPEPAWSLITQHSERVCGNCNLRDLNLCAACPGVELLSRLLKGAQPA